MDYEVIAEFEKNDITHGNITVEIRKDEEDDIYDIVEVNHGYLQTNLTAEDVIRWFANYTQNLHHIISSK